MQGRGQGDVDHVELRILEHCIEIIVGGDAREVHLPARRAKVSFDIPPIAGQTFAILLANRSHLHPPYFLVRKVVDHAHKAEAGDSYAKHKRLTI